MQEQLVHSTKCVESIIGKQVIDTFFVAATTTNKIHSCLSIPYQIETSNSSRKHAMRIFLDHAMGFLGASQKERFVS